MLLKNTWILRCLSLLTAWEVLLQQQPSPFSFFNFFKEPKPCSDTTVGYFWWKNTKNQQTNHHRDNALFPLFQDHLQRTSFKKNNSDHSITQSQKHFYWFKTKIVTHIILCTERDLPKLPSPIKNKTLSFLSTWEFTVLGLLQ